MNPCFMAIINDYRHTTLSVAPVFDRS